jgi:hypothetical protein
MPIVVGKCHICGEQKKLSYEHIPPESCFNNSKALTLNGRQAMSLQLTGSYPGKPKQLQRGMGMYTLCEKCNSDTGRWYVDDFGSFCRQAVDHIQVSKGNPTLAYPYLIYPLRIIKQIVTMMMSINPNTFSEDHPALRDYVLNRHNVVLPEKYRFFICLNIDGEKRFIGDAKALSLEHPGEFVEISDIAFFPFGICLTQHHSWPVDNMMEITNFKNRNYDQKVRVFLKMPALCARTTYPGAYVRRNPKIKKLIIK